MEFETSSKLHGIGPWAVGLLGVFDKLGIINCHNGWGVISSMGGV